MIRRLLLVAVAAFSFAPVASAADLSVKGPVYKAAPAPVFNWTGFYVGAHVGYGFGDQTTTTTGTSADLDGITGGLQLGYNWQVSPNWIVGIETDFSFADIKGTDLGVEFTIEYFGSVRGRLGYAWDRTLLYVTGGFAYARSDSVFGPVNGGATHTGWTAGGGLEWALSRNWSAKVEYLYVDLSDEFLVAGAASSVSFEFSTVRLGVNYRW